MALPNILAALLLVLTLPINLVVGAIVWCLDCLPGNYEGY